MVLCGSLRAIAHSLKRSAATDRSLLWQHCHWCPSLAGSCMTTMTKLMSIWHQCGISSPLLWTECLPQWVLAMTSISLMPSVEASHDDNNGVDALLNRDSHDCTNYVIDLVASNGLPKRCSKNEWWELSSCAPLLVSNGGLPTSSSLVVDWCLHKGLTQWQCNQLVDQSMWLILVANDVCRPCFSKWFVWPCCSAWPLHHGWAFAMVLPLPMVLSHWSSHGPIPMVNPLWWHQSAVESVLSCVPCQRKILGDCW